MLLAFKVIYVFTKLELSWILMAATVHGSTSWKIPNCTTPSLHIGFQLVGSQNRSTVDVGEYGELILGMKGFHKSFDH